MRLISLLALLLFPAILPADAPNPLRFVAPDANLVVRIERPRQLVQAVTTLDLIQQMQSLPFVREQLQAPAYQRFQQLLDYAQKDLGAEWPELLDRLAGNGITLAGKAGGNDAPVLLIIDGTDADLAEKLLQLVVSVFEQELARQESKERIEKGDYRGVAGYKIGDLRLARVGSTILLANKKEALKSALDLNADHGKSLADAPGPREARKALPDDSLAWMWLDLDVARKAPNAKETFAQPSNDVISTVLVGGWLDVVRRAPFLAAGLIRDKDGFRLAVRLPGGGNDGRPPQMALHAPFGGKPGSMPLLEPRGVIYSQSFYFDFDTLYQQRTRLFNEKIARDFEDAEKQVKKFLLGNSLSQLYAQAGPYHRFVVAHQEKVSYETKPKQYYPAFAYVNTMRDPAMAKPMEGILRGVALLAGNAFKPKVFEEMRGSVKIVGYRFAEGVEVSGDAEGVRYNFTPCFAAVNNQFLMCSTIEFARAMVDLLQGEYERSQSDMHASPFRARFYGSGGAQLLHGLENLVLGQIVLDQAVRPEEGRQQLAALMDWARRLGTFEVRTTYLNREFRVDAEWKVGKKD